MTEQETLFALLEGGVTPYHTVEHCVNRLKHAGFEELDYEKKWNLEGGKKYYINHH